MTSENHLLLFTRYPTPGTTKTRLIPALGETGAAALQREMTEFTLRQARATHAHIEIRYTGGTEAEMRGWLGNDLQYAEQGAGDLGTRMLRAVEAHTAAGADRILIIGADCPAQRTAHLQAAFQALSEHDLVLGPATDGGYYCIGMKQPHPSLFRHIEWGSSTVLAQTLKAAAGLQVHQSPPLSDVDEAADLPPRISVIIPARNEATELPATLATVRSGFRIELIVVDGGSTDGTVSLATKQADQVFSCSEGRAAQQNLGAQKASGELLLFLHADTQLPENWDEALRCAATTPDFIAGAFRFKIRESFPGQRWVEWGTNLRATLRSLPYGDQGLFMHRHTFSEVDSFPQQPIMEDYELVRRLRRRGRLVLLPHPALTSARRWQQHGVLKVTVINQLMLLGYHLGIPPKTLARFYRGNRKRRSSQP